MFEFQGISDIWLPGEGPEAEVDNLYSVGHLS